MASYNHVCLLGNLTRDPTTKVLPGNTTVCEFGLAINRKWKTQGGEDREEVCFVDVAAFGRTGEVVAQYCQKGRPLLVSGRLKLDQWEDKQGGGKRSKLSVVAETVQLLGGREDGGGERREESPRLPPVGRERITNRPPPSNPIPDDGGIPDADIPF